MVAGMVMIVLISFITGFIAYIELSGPPGNNLLEQRKAKKDKKVKERDKKILALEKENAELREYNEALQDVSNWTPKEFNAKKE